MRVVPATPSLVPFLLERMGPERVAALAERVGGDPELAILANLPSSTITWAGIDPGGVVVLGGISKVEGQHSTGYVWQFLTDAVRQNKRDYLILSRNIVRMGHQRYERLLVAIEDDYKAAMRHIERMGGQIRMTEAMHGHLVHYYERTRA